MSSFRAQNPALALCVSALLALSLLAGLSNQSAIATQGDTAEARLDALIDDYLADYWHFHPDAASRAGLAFEHGYHGRLPRLTEAAVAEELASLDSTLNALAELPVDQLTHIDHRIDHDLLGRHARVRRAQLTTVPAWQREPRRYLPFSAFNDLVAFGDGLSHSQRAEALLSRLLALPPLLAAGQANLRHPPAQFVDDAIRGIEAQRPWFADNLPRFAATLPDHQQALLAAADAALVAIDDYLRFLRDELRPRADGEIAVGSEHYAFLLEQIHGLTLSAEEMIALGQRYVAETEALLAAQAEAMAPGSDWVAVTEQIRDHHPERHELLAAYCRDIQRSRQFVIEQNLVTVPANEAVHCVDSDPSQRAFSPFGTFRTPAPFSDEKLGYLILHPIPDAFDEAQATQRLRSHDFSWIEVIAPHEAYPGHHLQAILAQNHPRPLRKVYSTPVFTEGWGLYTEQLMHEQGFFRQAEASRLTQLRLQLWRAWRVVLDASLHSGALSVEQARRALAEGTGMAYDATAGEVNIYVYRPSYAIGYMVGYHEMMALRAAQQARLGEQFDLKAFHDQVLGLGSLPFPLVHQLMASPP